MIGMAILKPVVALAAWTMLMWLWMYATRLPAMSAAKVDPDSLVKDRVKSLDDLLPAHVQWKAHNYNHLHEAPTVFYAVALALAMIGQASGLRERNGSQRLVVVDPLEACPLDSSVHFHGLDEHERMISRQVGDATL